MNTNQKIYFFITCSLSILFYSNTVKADVIFPGVIINPFITVIIGLALTLFIELFIASQYFKGYKKGMRAVLFANLISYLIFLLTQILRNTPFEDVSKSILILEPIIILLESIVIKIYLPEKMSYGAAISLSFLLNFATIGMIVLYCILLLDIGITNKAMIRLNL